MLRQKKIRNQTEVGEQKRKSNRSQSCLKGSGLFLANLRQKTKAKGEKKQSFLQPYKTWKAKPGVQATKASGTHGVRASLLAQTVKNLPAMWKTWV